MSGRVFYLLVGLVVAAGLAVGLLIDPAVATSLFKGRGKAEPGFAYVTDARQPPERMQSEMPAGFPDRVRKPPRPCSMPRVADGDQLIMVGAYEGAAMSSVAVNGVNAETSLAEVEIQPGDQPLYVVMSSFSPMIWRFSGATDRIRHLVLVSQARTAQSTAAVGVIGVPAAVISAAPPQGCFGHFYEPGSTNAKTAVKSVDNAAGRKPDIMVGLYAIEAVQLPSGMASRPDRRRLPKAPQGFDAAAWKEAAWFSPAGLANVDPASVAGPVTAERYDILPNQMGLAQLTGAGALQPFPGGFRVVRPIAHYPAEMGGAHMTNLRLAAGVPIPAGSPGHSCVIAESTGLAVDGTICDEARGPGLKLTAHP